MTPTQKKRVEDNINLAHMMALRFRDSLSHDEAFSVACLGLVKASLNYEDERGKFSTFACVVMQNELIMAIRKLTTHYYRYNIVSIHMPTVEDGPCVLGDVIGSKEHTRIIDNLVLLDVLAAINKLPCREKYIITETAMGTSQDDIAKTLGITQSYASRLLLNARKKVAEASGYEFNPKPRGIHSKIKRVTSLSN